MGSAAHMRSASTCSVTTIEPISAAIPAPTAPASQSSGFGLFLLTAFGAGLAAIFTPCVFPMIPFTVSYFINRQTGNRRDGVLQATWTSPRPTGFTGYTVMLVTDGRPAETFPRQVPNFALQRTLVTTSTYTLQVAMNVTGQPPSLTPIVTLITQAPTVTSIANSGSAVVYRWTAAGGSGVGGYFAGLDTPATNWTSWADARTFTARFDHALAGVGACTGWVRAASGDGIVLGPPSAVRPVITEAPALTSIDNTGSAVIYNWTAAAGGGVQAYFAGLDTPSTNFSNSTNAQTLTARFDQALAGVGTCTGWVRAASSDGVVLGPPTTVYTLITAAPAFSSIVNSGTSVVYTWTAPPGATVAGYFAGLDTATTNWSNPSSGLTTRFDHALAGVGTCTAWVRATGSGNVVLGPPAPVRTVITEMPTMTLIANNGPSVDFTWAAATGSGVEGYRAYLSLTGTVRVAPTDPGVLTAHFSEAPPDQGSNTGWVRASSRDGIVLGPPTAALTLISGTPVLSEVDYDIGQLTVGWQPHSGPGATDYQATVQGGGMPAQNFPLGSTSGTGTAAVTLQIGQSYMISVRATAPRLMGPPSNLVQALDTRPQVAAVTATAPSGFKVAWRADPDPRVTGYVAEFFANGVSQGTMPLAASPANFPGSLATGVIYQARVRSTAIGLKGPWTDRANGPYQSLQVPAFDTLGRLTNLTWTGGGSVAYTLDNFGNVQSVDWHAP